MRRGSLARNISAGWVANLVRLAIGFVVLPILVRRLGDVRFGLFSLVFAIAGYSSLFYLGFGSAVLKFGAAARARGDWEGLNRVAGTVFAAYVVVGVAVIALGTLLSAALPSITRLAPATAHELRVFGTLVAVAIAVQIPGSVFGSLIRAAERFEIVESIHLVAIAVRAGLIVALVAPHSALPVLGWIEIGVVSCEAVAKAVASYRIYPGLRLGAASWQPGLLRELGGFAIPIFLYQAADRVLFYTDNVVIGAFRSPADITLYSIAGRLVEYSRQLVFKVRDAIAPRASSLDAAQQTEVLAELIVRACRLNFALVTLISVQWIAFGGPIIRLLFGPDYAPSYDVLVILTFAFWLRGPHMIFEALLWGVGRARFLAVTSGAEAAANLVLSLALVGPYGVIGVALGTAIPTIVNAVFVTPVAAIRQIGVPALRVLTRAVLPPLALAIPLAIVNAAVVPRPVDAWAPLLFWGGAGALAYGAAAVALFVRRAEFELLLQSPPAETEPPLPGEDS